MLQVQVNYMHTIHMLTHTYTHTHSSYMTLIGVHEMHGRMHSNSCHVTDLFVRDPLSSSDYPMIVYTGTHPITDNLPKKPWLLGDYKQTHTHTWCENNHLEV